MNELIVKRIKETRLEKGLTQQDLANRLGKTAAAISDLERGKVQVTASDLFLISQLLQKPIEFFYGEEYGEAEIQDLITLVRRESPDVRKQTIETVKMLLQMQKIGEKLSENPDAQLPIEDLKEFFNLFISFSKQVNDTTNQVNDIRDMILQELKEQGVDITG